jgi:MarR family 2-MHQ and catechol resistance regulon transcriptional repressor
LSQKILKSGANITTVVDNLESRGLAERKRDSTDRRVVFVHLTAQGGEVIQRLFPIHAKKITETMSRLDMREQHVLGALCRKLGAVQMPSEESSTVFRSQQENPSCPHLAEGPDKGEGEQR